jgi:hypothetical protein
MKVTFGAFILLDGRALGLPEQHLTDARLARRHFNKVLNPDRTIIADEPKRTSSKIRRLVVFNPLCSWS